MWNYGTIPCGSNSEWHYHPLYIPGTEHSWQQQDEAVDGLQLVSAGQTDQIHLGVYINY